MAKKADHITNYFVLPLIGLNKSSFSEGTFINAYLRSDNTVMVELKKPNSFYHGIELFVSEYQTHENTTCVIFKVPEKFRTDLELFRNGKYSKLSDAAKEMIKKYSGLPYLIPHPTKVNRFITDERLLALDKDPEFKALLEMNIGQEIDEDMELLSIPSDDELVQATL